MKDGELIARFGEVEGAPQRACNLMLKVCADSPDEVIKALNAMAFEIGAGRATHGMSCGWGSAYSYVFTAQNGPTHDEYFEQAEKFLASRSQGQRVGSFVEA
jgi:hypothetical protein